MLDRWFAAFNAHDVDALLELADPAIEVIPVRDAESAPPGTSYHGREGLKTLLSATFARFPRLRLDYTRPQGDGERITVNLAFLLDDGVNPALVRAAVCDYRVSNGRIKRMRAFERATRTAERSATAALTPREREVLALIAGGNTVPQIADDLTLSPLTVRTHIRNAKDKLRARTTAHAVAIALDDRALDV